MTPQHLTENSSTGKNASLNDWATWLVCLFLRHWLALLLTPTLILGILPFLAPIAMHSGWIGTGQAIYWLYSPFCHQLPQRSWFLFGPKLTYTLAEINQVYPYTDGWHLRRFDGSPEMGWKVAWSDRMISFYSMTPVFGLLYAALRRVGRVVQPLSLQALLLTLVPMALDGITHLISDLVWGIAGGGFRDTNAWLIFLTANAFPGFYGGDTFGTFNWWMRLVTGLVAACGLTFSLLPFLNQLIGEEERRF